MNGWEFEPARDKDLQGIERHRSLQREHGLAASVCRLFWWGSLRLIFRIWNRLDVSGRENLPNSPPFILVANHTSHLDAPLLASMLPPKWRDQISPVAASDTFFENLPTAAFAAWFLNALAIRRRGTGAHDLERMRERLIKENAVFIIFPEGTRSRSGKMQPFKSGIGRLVAESKIPVVPCKLEGCAHAWPPGGHFIKPTKLRIKIGEPVSFGNCPDNRSGWNDIAKQLHERIEKLGQ
ncbi:MAG: lysophospholipid acyltransferase family protein [Akkermansiaceae bacterium]